ncbi:MAG TPA: protein kinase [Longimicrobiaceae bacterium]|nr:protein kinase [Longimicrobiaceae bacterium]
MAGASGRWWSRFWPGRRAAAPADAPDHWRQLQEILHSALETPSGERMAFVAGACADRPELRREVESLLAAHARPSVLDRPPAVLLGLAPAPGAQTPPRLDRSAPHYEIVEKVGGGGMGVVYRARDRRLGRSVALKFLPPHLNADEHARERFLVEAQAAAALDHPNICTLYEAGETDDGHLFLAMPFYEGETLKRRLTGGALTVAEALDVAVQVANGLEKAHERGIVHRDIKPANLVVTGDGVVKIVDFGIAKLAHAGVTRPGIMLGTLAYMSPEQAEGREVDGRTDLWSLGVVLYEMLTGERPFRGEHDRVLLHAITAADPRPPTALRPDVPARVEAAVLRALARSPTERYATAREMSAALDAIRAPALPGAAPAVPRLDSGEGAFGGVAPGGERRQATIVVSTISGYDSLVERRVPGEVEQVLAGLRAAAEAVAAAHGGVLNQFAGDELVLLFGVPTTREDDAIRAARAALELHARVRALAPEGEGRDGEHLVLHTGIDTGRVVSHPEEGAPGTYRLAGAAAQVAARLARQAGRDEVWASPECRHLIGACFDSEPREAIALRDRRQPLVPYRVLRASGLQTRIEAQEKAGLTAYTGRDGELAALRRCLADALAGEGQLVTVTGEPGIGKSRLLHEFRQGVGASGVPVLMGRCQPHGAGVAYLPFVEILRAGLGLGEDAEEGREERTAERIRAISPALEEFIPLYLHLLSVPSSRYTVPRHLQGDAFRLAMQEALAAVLTLNAQREPGVVLLEDWHWADEASHAVLRQVAEVMADSPLLVLVTLRPGYGMEWSSPGQHAPIALRPLDPASTESMLRSLLKAGRVPADLAALIHERTGGNPFFIEEICQALVEEGALRPGGGDVVLAGPLQMLELPDSIQAVIRARLDRLDRDARDVVRLAAVVGREFTRTLLERTVTDGGTLPQALERLKAAGLVQQTRVAPEAGYRFKHVLTQEVAYSSLLEHQRRELHARVGAQIEQLYADRMDDHADRLAHHFSRAEEWEKAVAYGLRSAERAGALAQFSEALQVLERTQRWLAKLPAGAVRHRVLTDLLLRQERLCETLGLRARQQQIIDELISLLDPGRDGDRLAEVYLRQGDLFTLLRQFDRAEQALDRSLRLRRDLGDRIGERNTLRSLGLLRWHEGRNRQALDFAEPALRIAREQGEAAAIVGDLVNQGAILRALGELDLARASLQEALHLAEAADPGDGGAAAADDLSVKCVYALQHLANIHRERGERAQALECLHRAGELAELKRLPIQLSYHYTSVAHVYLQEGDVEESLRYYREAIDLTRKAKYAPGLAQSLRISGEVLLGLGRHDEALSNLHEAATLFAQLKDLEGEAAAWSSIAAAREREGEQVPALAAWSRAAALHRQLQHAAGEMEALEGLGRTTRRHVAEPSLALAHYHPAAELARTAGDRAAEGRLRNTIGLLEWSRGEYEQALASYERALALYRELGDGVHAGLMLNSIGATLKAQGRSDEAERRLHEAVALHRETGERKLEGHALALLGDICAERDEPQPAGAYYRQSLEIRRAIGDRRGEGWMLHDLARAELAGGLPYEVRERVASAAQIAAECGDTELATACEQLRRMAD